MWKWIAVVVGMIVADLVVLALTEGAGPNALLVRNVGTAVIMFSGGFGSLAMKRHAESVTLSNEPDSFERHVATHVPARVFMDTIIAAGVGMLVALYSTWPGAALLAAVMAVGMADYWIRYGNALRNGCTAFGATRTNNTVAERRRARGWSEAELASRLRVSRRTIMAIEGGRFDPSLPLALRLSEAFDATVEDLFRPAADTT